MQKPYDGVSVLEFPQAALRPSIYRDEIPQATLPPMRLRTILHRLHTDFYSRDEVLACIAGRVPPNIR